MAIGAVFRFARERSGFSQRQLADFAGVSSSLITRLERDELNPTWKTLQKLADVLQVEPVLRLVPNDLAVQELAGEIRTSKPAERLRKQPANAMSVLSLFQSYRVPHVVGGAAAALVQGFATPVHALSVIVENTDEGLKALGQVLLSQLLLFDDVEPDHLREFVERSWGFNDCEVRITLATELPPAIDIELLSDFTVQVLPPDLLLEDEEVSAILRIAKMRSSEL